MLLLIDGGRFHGLVLVGEVGLALRLHGLGLDRDRRRHRGVGVVRADVDDVAARLREALALAQELLGGLLRADLEVVVAGVVHCFARWRLDASGGGVWRVRGARRRAVLPVARLQHERSAELTLRRTRLVFQPVSGQTTSGKTIPRSF